VQRDPHRASTGRHVSRDTVNRDTVNRDTVNRDTVNRDTVAAMSTVQTPGQRWGSALGQWAIPAHIIDQAPQSPWVHPPAMFAMDDAAAAADDTASHRWARRALAGGGSVLDVGCGGGRSSVVLVPEATLITGVDEQAAMLVNFAAACERAGVAHREVEGRWLQVASDVEVADVVVCHHVVFNVAEIEPFVQQLSRHARRRVVVELPAVHPTAPFNPLWKHFWDLERPSEPTAELFVDVVRSLGEKPLVETTIRPPRKPTIARGDYVAFVRTRLCLGADRDEEINQMLGEGLVLNDERIVTVTWEPS
jgi:2-polyprenyl-3-methyl-5-hydroxy-6-metoxy-1,4-benzoquinol methylase